MRKSRIMPEMFKDYNWKGSYEVDIYLNAKLSLPQIREFLRFKEFFKREDTRYARLRKGVSYNLKRLKGNKSIG